MLSLNVRRLLFDVGPKVKAIKRLSALITDRINISTSAELKVLIPESIDILLLLFYNVVKPVNVDPVTTTMFYMPSSFGGLVIFLI